MIETPNLGISLISQNENQRLWWTIPNLGEQWSINGSTWWFFHGPVELPDGSGLIGKLGCHPSTTTIIGPPWIGSVWLIGIYTYSPLSSQYINLAASPNINASREPCYHMWFCKRFATLVCFIFELLASNNTTNMKVRWINILFCALNTRHKS